LEEELLTRRAQGFNPQQHFSLAAVGVMAIHAQALGRRDMLPERGRFLVAREADPLLRHGKHHQRHVAPRLGEVANLAGTRHYRMHGRSAHLGGVTRYALTLFRYYSRMLNGPTGCNAAHQQQQCE